jgi:hypothetical protein
VIAKRAGLNCGQCKTTIRAGRYDNRHEVEVNCETQPVCEEHYLHRLRKTAATNWLRSGFDLMTIRSWLGRKSLDSSTGRAELKSIARLQETLVAPSPKPERDGATARICGCVVGESGACFDKTALIEQRGEIEPQPHKPIH